MWIETVNPGVPADLFGEFIRQQWRMWIETDYRYVALTDYDNSFASNGECGLKLRWQQDAIPGICEFIRQQWRMWIETSQRSPMFPSTNNSFASNGECGLKPRNSTYNRSVCF